MSVYNHDELELKWQKKWQEANLFKTEENTQKEKYFLLEMFPYPSGALHMGHMRNYSIGDVVARYHKMTGKNVLHPMGWDSFGLPAENAAIKHNTHPSTWTDNNIANMKNQLNRLGFSYDWEREVTTCKPDYYKWTQWIFLQLYKAGLVYKKEAAVNWCDSCGTVLANEQVINNKCWRCDTDVLQKDLSQWFIKITDYAEELLTEIDNLKGWPESVKIMQKNWIGKSNGTELKLPLKDLEGEIEVFTTRADTVFGMTYVCLAPEHPLIKTLVKNNPKANDIEIFVQKTRNESKIDRTNENSEKEGFFTGHYAINPANNRIIPIYIANYVLMNYGTGAVMAVPAHDTRDFAFAKKYNLEIIEVISKDGQPTTNLTEAYIDSGILLNSEQFNGQNSLDAKSNISNWLATQNKAKITTNYKIRDWLFSRQRYWGVPIPIVYCDCCGIVPENPENLPIKLPLNVNPVIGEKSALATSKEFLETTCPKCGGKATRESDTMDTFICSSWYYLRYSDPKNSKEIFAKDKVNYWQKVDQYIGGIEHAVLHLLYARFINKFLHHQGLIKYSEPFENLLTQGMVIKDGAKMSKSKGNVVDPLKIIKDYGADTARLFILFAAPPEKELEWNDNGIEGSFRFINRIWRLQEQIGKISDQKELDKKLHKTIKAVTEDIESFSFNTAISRIMELINTMYQVGVDKKSYETMLILLNVFAPHVTEEIWHLLGHSSFISKESWPTFDQKLTIDDTCTVVFQVNGKLRGKIELAKGHSKEEIEKIVLADETLKSKLEGLTIRKVIVVPDKLVNIVAN